MRNKLSITKQNPEDSIKPAKNGWLFNFQDIYRKLQIMTKREKALRALVRKQAKATIQEQKKQKIKESVSGWVIDKISNGLKWATNKHADYQYDGLLKSKEFKSLARHYKMSERDWDKKARQLMKKDPDRFADTLMYDLRKRRFSKYFYEE